MPINKPDIEQLRKKTDSTYTLVVQAARRARQLMDGAQSLVEDDEQKPLTLAIEEINRGLITYHRKLEDE
ncbi:MAG: DNA-directed RNA polymerase subunit omega [Clostridiales bacterium]|jgi:DNA-directed RNA polymerase subunit omega|nr:DNA-directed RNA polymerase subunit omega [Clostridiales bacterium]